MKNISFREIIPYVAAILIFLIITLAYFNPLLSGKKLRQDDIIRHKGMSKEIYDFRVKTGEEALWTNSMFGGMPAYQISVQYRANLFRYFDDVLQLGLPRPAGYMFLYFLGFFILLLTLRVNPWLSIIGAVAFAFSSYFLIIIQAGHNSKAHAIAYMAPVLAGIILTYRGKYILGGLIAAFFLALEIEAGHPQITYYLLIIIVILGIIELIYTFMDKRYKHFLRATGILIIAAILATFTHFTSLWATYEYGKDTIRGKSELTSNKDNQTTGLDKDYATAWSYGVSETFSLMIPNAKGGATGLLGNNPNALKKVDRQYTQSIAQMNQYWGDQPFTSGPVYVGSIVIFLFILGLFFVKGRLKWLLVIATLLSILLSWGKNFMPLTDFFLDYIPGYNKFRAVSMTLVIAELCIPILAVLAVNEIVKNPGILKEKRKSFFVAFGLTGGLALLFYLFPGLFNFFADDEINSLKSQYIAQFRNAGYSQAQMNEFVNNHLPVILDNLEQARISVFKADAIRTFLYVILGAAVLWLYGMGKLGRNILIAVLGVLILIDMATICYRYLNDDDYVRKSKIKTPYQATIADQEIIKDRDPYYRVFNMSVNTFNDASTSYFHKSIGGYHGAKLRRYQELIDYGIMPERQKILSVFQNNPGFSQIDNLLRQLPVLNMLNTKYIILDPAQPPLQNRYALGNAWFVNNFEIVENADGEIKGISEFNPKQTALIDKRFESYLTSYNNGVDSLAFIKLVNYKPNKLTYKFGSSKDQLTVFSEIYYNKGWNAYVDGVLIPHFRVDYVLRAMIIPAGVHNIEYRFEPTVYTTGERVSLISSILLIILIVGGLYLEFRGKVKPEE